MFFLQFRCLSTYLFSRDDNPVGFETALEALEERDRYRHEYQQRNDGLQRAVRVVAEDGAVVEYQ
jgi:hypothetical protein